MFFMCDVLEILSDMSLKFQKNDLTVDQAIDEQYTAFLRLTALGGDDIGKWQQQVVETVALTGKFQGVELTNVNQNLLKDGRKTVTGMCYMVCNMFTYLATYLLDIYCSKRFTYSESIIDNVAGRLADLSSKSVLSNFSAFDPSMWPELDYYDTESKR